MLWDRAGELDAHPVGLSSDRSIHERSGRSSLQLQVGTLIPGFMLASDLSAVVLLLLMWGKLRSSQGSGASSSCAGREGEGLGWRLK